MYFLNKILRIISHCNDVSKKSSFYWVATKVVIRFFFVPFCLRILWVAWIGKIKLTVFFFFLLTCFCFCERSLISTGMRMGHCGRQERRILGRILRALAVTFQFQHWSNRLRGGEPFPSPRHRQGEVRQRWIAEPHSATVGWRTVQGVSRLWEGYLLLSEHISAQVF